MDSEFLIRLFTDAGGTPEQYEQFLKSRGDGPDKERKMNKKQIIEQLRAKFGAVASLKDELEGAIKQIEADDATQGLVDTLEKSLTKSKEIEDLKAAQAAPAPAPSEDFAKKLAEMESRFTSQLTGLQAENKELTARAQKLEKDNAAKTREFELSRIKGVVEGYSKAGVPPAVLKVVENYCTAPEALNPQTMTLKGADGKTDEVKQVAILTIVKDVIDAFPAEMFKVNLTTATTQTGPAAREQVLTDVEQAVKDFDKRLPKTMKPEDRAKAHEAFKQKLDAQPSTAN